MTELRVVETGEGAVDDFMVGIWDSLTRPIWDMIGQDDLIFEGLDARTVSYLRARLAERPDLRATLAKAADYRRRTAALPRTSRATARLVYFISANASGLIKIGSAVDPEARLRTLQTGSPERLSLIATTGGDQQRERELHRKFAASRVHGEWFRPTTDLIGFIGGLS